MKYLGFGLMNLGLLALSLGMLPSCSREEGKSLIINNPTISTKHSEGYLRLSVSRPNDVTLRSLGQDPMAEVKTLLLLFYRSDNETLHSVKELSISSPDQMSNIAVKLEPRDYKLVVLANPSTNVRALVNPGSPLSNLTSGQALISNDLLDPASKLMLMSNEQGAVAVSSANFKSDASALSTAISVSLEPALARVLVYGTPTLRAGTTGSAPARYLVTNIQKSAYVLRQLNTLSGGGEEQAGDNSERNRRYAKSPMWMTWSQTPPTNSDAVGAFSTEQSSAEYMGAQVLQTAEAFKAQLAENLRLYHKESTVPESAYFLSTVPCAVIAYPYIPQGLTLEQDEGFVSYQGRYYRESQVKEMMRTHDRVSAPQLMHAIEESRITQDAFNAKQGFEKGGIKFFYKGYSYYSVFIKHFGNTDSRYGFYGLVRGNEYHIRLVKINDPGSPTPLVYTNNMNPISEDQSSALKVQVSSLSTRNQEVEL